MDVRRDSICYTDLSSVVRFEQGEIRPVLIVQNDVGNRPSPTVIVAAITSQRTKAKLPTHIMLDAETTGLVRDSTMLLERIHTIDKHKLKKCMGRLDDVSMSLIDQALFTSFGLELEAEVRQATQKSLNYQQYEKHFYLTHKE